MDIIKENIEPERFIDKKKVLEMFEIDSVRFDLKPVVEGFNISTKVIDYPALSYKLEDVKMAISEVKEFCETHYFAKEAKAILNSGIKTYNLETVDVPKYYIGLLNKTYHTKGKTKAYRKSDIDTLRNKIDKKQTRISTSKALKEKTDELINIGKYILVDGALEKLSLPSNSNSYTLIKKLREMNYISAIKTGKSYYYSIEDIDNLIQKKKRFF